MDWKRPFSAPKPRPTSRLLIPRQIQHTRRAGEGVNAPSAAPSPLRLGKTRDGAANAGKQAAQTPRQLNANPYRRRGSRNETIQGLSPMDSIVLAIGLE